MDVLLSLFKRSLILRRCALLAAALALSGGTLPATAADAAASADLIARGAYLANAGDCVGCHTAKNGKALAGGQYIQTPYGGISTPNITPDRATGIGAWTDEEFYRVMHEGIGRHGEPLYPVMPFPWYSNVTREDVAAIRAYLASQPAVHQPRPPNKLSFPYSVRQSLWAWRAVFFKPAAFKPDPSQPADVNRGAYLVNGLAHCGECHNSRPVAGTSKWRQPLQGGVVDNWYAPNITSDTRDGIGGWSDAEIAHYLKTGSTPRQGVALGPMAEAVHSLSHLDDADLLAIAAYLKTTPPKAGDEAKRDLFAGRDARGGDAYLNYCASCHGVDGKGVDGVVPPLNGNGAVTARGPQNVISVVLGGLAAQGSYAPMPAIGVAMSDQQVADAVNYVRQTWANAAPPTAMPGLVAQLRGALDTPMNAGPGQSCPAITAAPLAKAVGDEKTHLRDELASVDDANMPQRADRLVAKARSAAPGVRQDALINGLTAAYCDVLKSDTSLDRTQKALRLGHFSQLVYSAAAGRHPAR